MSECIYMYVCMCVCMHVCVSMYVQLLGVCERMLVFVCRMDTSVQVCDCMSAWMSSCVCL